MVPTPNIDAMSAEGIRFSRWSMQHVCSPTRTSLFMSRYPWRDGLGGSVIVNGVPNDLPWNYTVLPQVLKRGTTSEQQSYADQEYNRHTVPASYSSSVPADESPDEHQVSGGDAIAYSRSLFLSICAGNALALGKWDCGMTYNASLPTKRGFDRFQGYYDAD